MVMFAPFIAKPLASTLSPVHSLALSSTASAINGVSSSSISVVKSKASIHDCSLIDCSGTKFIVDKTSSSISDNAFESSLE